MASKLKVDDLRAELTKRGLSTAGNKSALVRRLEDAIEEEEKAAIGADGGAKKRERDEAYGGDSYGVPVKKIKEVENFGDMNVKQLREQAKILGVSAAGNKKELFERLCAGFSDSDGTLDSINPKEEQEDEQEKEEEKEKEKDEAGGRDSNDGPVKKIKAVEKFGDMNVKQLREQAKILGVSAAGTKKLLFERLCAGFLDTDGFADSINPAKEEQEDEQEKEKKKEKEKIVTATKKGAAVLDQYLPDDIKSQYHILQLGDDVYDAMLNQTNVGDNNNKFYVIQLLESDDGSRFMVYNRWGRVGIKGQDKLFGPYTLKDAAISEFEQKFYAKTKNHWSERKEFECISKCYTWLEMDYSEKETVAVKEKPEFATAIQPRETKLETRVAIFISLICNVSMMKQQMMEIGYNANKLPLGKLSKSTILKGYGVLKRIADVIGISDRRTLEQLSGEFYTVIPHDFGFKKMREFVIDTPQKLKYKLEMVEALGEIELATKLLENESTMQEDPLLCHYHRLGCELIPIEVDSKEYSTIAMYLQNTHAKTHSQYTVDIVQIFRVSRAGEDERFQKFSSTRNRMLLWHGSRLSNWTGILSQGLRIAPPDAPVTGYMFGKGVYFADMFSKSANYCYSTQAAPDGVLLLCEVALGDMAELLQAKYDADKLPEGKLSTKGVGGTAPDLSEAKAFEDGVIVPLGKPKEQQCTKGALLYNEYIVYNVDQIRMRYVLQVNFKYTRH